MRAGTKIRTWLVLGLATLTASSGLAQLKVGNETSLNLNATASVGYDRTWDGSDSDDIVYGFNGLLSGFYHDPRFLSFSANPFLNQSNTNSSSTSSTLASGIYSQAQFLSATKTPMEFSYSRDYNRQSTMSIPGSGIGYLTHGNGQGFGAAASYLPDDWPSITAAFAHTGSDYEAEGQPGIGHSHLNSLTLNSGYNIWGTTFNATFAESWVNSQTPILGTTETQLDQNTNSNLFLISASRAFGTRGSVGFGYSRSGTHGSYAGTSLDSTYNNFQANGTLKATSRINLGAFLAYSSDLTGSFFSNVISGIGAQKGTQGSAAGEAISSSSTRYTSDFLSYGADAGYQVLSGLSLTARIDHRIQGQQDGLPDFTSTTMSGTALYTHKLWGGGLGLSSGVSYSFAPIYTIQRASTSSGGVTAKETGQTSFVGNNESLSYSHHLGAWYGSINGNYSHGLTTYLVGYTQTSYGAGANLSRAMKNWAFNGSANYSHTHVDASSLSDTNSETFTATLSHRNLSGSGSYSKSQGNALQVGGSIVPVAGSTAGIEENLIQYHGESYGAGLGWRPKRRLSITANYAHLDYSSLNPLVGPTPVRTLSTQISARSEYSFRQLSLVIGYSRVEQSTNQTNITPYLFNSFFFGITRSFNFF